VTRELEHHLIKSTTDNVGIIALEEDWRRTIDGILSIEANARLYVDEEREKFSKEELDKMFDILYDLITEIEYGFIPTLAPTTLMTSLPSYAL
jgi:hypothetical protein